MIFGCLTFYVHNLSNYLVLDGVPVVLVWNWFCRIRFSVSAPEKGDIHINYNIYIYICSRYQECSFVTALVFSVALQILCHFCAPQNWSWECNQIHRMEALILGHEISGKIAMVFRVLAYLARWWPTIITKKPSSATPPAMICLSSMYNPCKINKGQKLKVPLWRMDNDGRIAGWDGRIAGGRGAQWPT